MKRKTYLHLPSPTATDLRWREYKGYLVCCDHVDMVIVGGVAVALVSGKQEAEAA